MISDMLPRFCVVSHILPPSPTGQSIMLSRLFSEIDPVKYSLLSRENYGSEIPAEIAAKRLPASHHYLRRLILSADSLANTMFSFLTSTLEIMFRAVQIAVIVMREKRKVIIACTGDLYDLPAALLASRMSGAAFIPYVFDDYAFQWTGSHRKISMFWEPKVMKRATKIIVANEGMRGVYLERYGLTSVVIHNPCYLPYLAELDSHNRLFDSRFINIVYAGAIYHAHYDAFRNLIKGIKFMKKEGIRLHLFTAQPVEELSAQGISGEMVECHSHVNEAGIQAVLRQADILFLPLAFDSPIPEVIRTSAPGKVGEYLAVGRPVLVHAPPDAFISRYFSNNDCGVVVDEQSPEKLCEAIDRISSDSDFRQRLMQRARFLAERDFNVIRSRDILYETLINAVGNSMS